MLYKLRIARGCAFLLCLLVIHNFAYSQELLGDGNDGNRTSPIHLIPLLDEDGNEIDPASETPVPFSIKKTCGKCHNYDEISKGWHFNGAMNSVDPGRPGQPWVIQDNKLRIQLPVGRNWKGCYSAEDLGIGPWDYTTLFGSHYPGGGYAETPDVDNPQAMLKGMVAGAMEINCFACHSGDPQQDQSLAALMIYEQNYKWAPVASCGLADIQGSVKGMPITFDPILDDPPVKMTYRKEKFDHANRVFFDLKRSPIAERCYFCHSNESQAKSGEKGWTCDQDIHLTSGMTCTDCHRNGLNHMISRGDASSGTDRKPVEMETLTCEGCHYGDDREKLSGGRLSAPKPAHVGLPIVHFEELTCTACHSGPVPHDQADLVRTSRMHKTGLHGKHGSHPSLPHVSWPVFMPDSADKIAPHKLMWPAFWGTKTGEAVKPLTYAFMKEKLEDQLSSLIKQEKVNNWLPLSEEQITEALKSIAGSLDAGSSPVYVAGGKVFELAGDGALSSATHEAAQPFAWPLAHDVRPAQQALGSNGCKDCHTNDAPIFYGEIAVDTPIVASQSETVAMIDFIGEGLFIKLFNASFAFRPMLKILCSLICLALVGLLAVYALRMVGWITQFMTGSCQPAPTAEITPHRNIIYHGLMILVALGCLASLFVLAATGFYALFIAKEPMSEFLLMIHVTMAPVFAVCLMLLAFRLAHASQFKLNDCFFVLLKKICFWATIILALPVILSIILSMVPLFGTPVQEFLYHLHQLATVLITLTLAGYGILFFLTSKKKTV